MTLLDRLDLTLTCVQKLLLDGSRRRVRGIGSVLCSCRARVLAPAWARAQHTRTHPRTQTPPHTRTTHTKIHVHIHPPTHTHTHNQPTHTNNHTHKYSHIRTHVHAQERLGHIVPRRWQRLRDISGTHGRRGILALLGRVREERRCVQQYHDTGTVAITERDGRR